MPSFRGLALWAALGLAATLSLGTAAADPWANTRVYTQYKPGYFNLEVIPVCKGPEVDRIEQQRLAMPDQGQRTKWYKGIRDGVDQGTIQVPPPGRTITVILREVQGPASLPLVNYLAQHIGQSANFHQSSDPRGGVEATIPLARIGIEMPRSFLNGPNTGFEIRTTFPIYYSPGGPKAAYSLAGRLRANIDNGDKAFTWIAVVECGTQQAQR